jgi:hypothetical protein
MSDQHNWTRIAAGAYAAKRGVDVYHDTGDLNAGIRTGTDLLGALWLICLGVSIILLCGFLSLFTVGFLLGVLVGAILLVLGVHLLRRTLRRANVASLPQAPPPIP